MKQLILFELLFCDIDLSNYNYASIDADGELYVYVNKPFIISPDSDDSWDLALSDDNIDGFGISHEDITFVTFDATDIWKDSLIEL